MTKTLTGNDIALATFACAHAINWCKEQGRGKYWRVERAKFEALSVKLQSISDEAHPLTTDVEGGILEFGSEEIMCLDARVCRRLQTRLKREGAVT